MRRPGVFLCPSHQGPPSLDGVEPGVVRRPHHTARQRVRAIRTEAPLLQPLPIPNLPCRDRSPKSPPPIRGPQAHCETDAIATCQGPHLIDDDLRRGRDGQAPRLEPGQAYDLGARASEPRDL
jgi:hypothetical protein